MGKKKKRYIKSEKEVLLTYNGRKECSTLCMLMDYLSSYPFHSNFTDYKALYGKFACEKWK